MTTQGICTVAGDVFGKHVLWRRVDPGTKLEEEPTAHNA